MTTPIPSTPYASASLYVGDLLPDVSEALLYEVFNAVGPVASVRVCRDAATRRSLGYAYVNFHRVEDAERALDTMNFKNIRQQACRIMWSHRDPSLRRSGLGNIFVKGLSTDPKNSVDNKQLYDTFSMFGNILSCKVATNAKGKSLGYGFVHYESEEAAQSAIERVNGKIISNHTVSVSPFKSMKERGGGLNKNVFTNVYVKGFPDDWTKETLDDAFAKFGPITSSTVVKGFGFVAFASPEQASAAVRDMNNVEVAVDRLLYVARAQRKEEREKELRERFERVKFERQQKYAGANLYVKNLADDIDEHKLRAEFSQFGAITSAVVMRDQQTNKSKGFGFVCFSSADEATKCVTEMNGRMIDQKPLYVALAQRKEVRRAQLEAQHAQRSKLGFPQPHIYGPQGGPAPHLYYQGMQRNFVYPPMGPQQRWGPSQVIRQPHPPMQYQLMPMPAQQRPGPVAGPGGAPGPSRRGAKGGFRQGPVLRGTQRPEGQSTPDLGGGPVQTPLTIPSLAAAPEPQRKQMIGERLFPLIRAKQPELAGKITGMLLEMENGELLILLEDGNALDEKIDEALAVLRDHEVA